MKKKNYKWIVTAIASALITNGCGLDEGEQPHPVSSSEAPVVTPQASPTIAVPIIPVVPSPIPRPSASLSPVPAQPKVSLTWRIGNSDCKKSLKRNITGISNSSFHFDIDAPFTLPWNVPDSVDLDIDTRPLGLNNRGTRFKAALEVINAQVGIAINSAQPKPDSPTLTPDSFSLNEGTAPADVVHFTLTGLERFFHTSADIEEKLPLKMSITEENSDSLPSYRRVPITLQLVLMTPPSKMMTTHRTLREYETARHTIPNDLKYMESGTYKLSLIQVVEVQDLSDQPIAVELPLKINGRLWQKGNWLDPQFETLYKTICWEDPKEIKSEETYSKEFALLPISKDLPDQLAGLLKNEDNSLEIYPNEPGIFGIYAIPTKAYEVGFKTLLSTRSPKEFSRNNPIQNVTLETKCDFTCGTVNRSDAFKNQCSTIPSTETDSKKDCDKRVSVCLSCFAGARDSYMTREHCNKCFEEEATELAFGVPLYKRESACTVDWKKTVLQTKTAKKGGELGPIQFEYRHEDLLMEVRYANLTKKEDPESRLNLILKQAGIQDQ